MNTKLLIKNNSFLENNTHFYSEKRNNIRESSTSIVMSKIMQNLVVLMEPSEEAWFTPLKAGNMILNRFCIDEDAAFDLSGVNYLKEPFWHEGMGFSFVWSYSISRNLISMNN